MGYDHKRRGYRLLSMETGKIVTARHGNVKRLEYQTIEAKFVDDRMEKTEGRSDSNQSQQRFPFIPLPVIDISQKSVPMISGIENKEELEDKPPAPICQRKCVVSGNRRNLNMLYQMLITYGHWVVYLCWLLTNMIVHQNCLIEEEHD